MSKDYIRPGYGDGKEDIIRSLKNPRGRDRRNRLKRDFDDDISIRKDQARMRSLERQWQDDSGSFDPHEYL